MKLLPKITLMKNSQFCEEISKSKHAIRVTLIMYFWLKCLIFLRFWQQIKMLTHMKKFHFWVECADLSENENEILKNSDFTTHGLMTIFNKWSKCQNDLINNLGDMAF